MAERPSDAPDGEESQCDNEEAELNTSNQSSDSVDTKRRRTQTPSPTPSSNMAYHAVPASPPKFVSFEELMATTNRVRNMALAHEIAIDNSFKLEKYEPQADSFEKQVHEIMHKAFWDCLEERLKEDPPDYSHAITLMEEVKKKLSSLLLPQHKRLRAQIDEVLDMELIRQKIDQDIFDIYYYSGYVIDTMAKLCAPARDENLENLRKIKDICPLFREMFEVLELMRMDMANYTIQQIRPYIQQQSVEYEKNKFRELLKTQAENGQDGLHFTKLWLIRNLKKLEESSEGAACASSITPASLLNESYMELLQWDNDDLFPETLLMDQSRLLDLREKTKKMTLISSILLVTYYTVGTPIAGVQSLKTKLHSQISILLDGVKQSELKTKIVHVAEQVNKEVGEALRELGFPEREQSKEDSLRGQIEQVMDESHTVHQLIRTRVLQFIYQMCFSRHSEPLKIPPGLSAVEKDLSAVCGQFLRLIAHNRSVFSEWYIDLIGHILKQRHSDLSPVKPV